MTPDRAPPLLVPDAAPTAVLLDMEWTAWPGSQTTAWTRAGEWREVVQIGALRLDAASLEELDAFEALVRPARNPVLSEYFTALTGIGQARLDAEGAPFADAFARLRRFRGDAPMYAYGQDGHVVLENLSIAGIGRPDDWGPCPDISRWFRAVAPGTATTVSSELARAVAGLPVRDAHTGLGDCRSIAAALRRLLADGAPNPFLEPWPAAGP